MARAIALTRHAFEAAQQRRFDLARAVIVIGCASALILAGKPLPL